jgi:hypothetical protein
MRKNILCGMVFVLLAAGLGSAAEDMSPLVIKVKPAKLTPLKTEALASYLEKSGFKVESGLASAASAAAARDIMVRHRIAGTLNFLREHLQPTARKKGREYKSPLPPDLPPRVVLKKEGRTG